MIKYAHINAIKLLILNTLKHQLCSVRFAAKSCPNPKKDLLWEDFATLACALNDGMPMQYIPLMQCIIHDSLAISIDSIHERGSHLQ